MRRAPFVLAAMATAALVPLLKPLVSPPVDAHELSATKARSSRSSIPAPYAPTRAAHGARSLAGSDPDGDIRLDGQGWPRPDREMRRRFDYVLAAMGERSSVQLRDDMSDTLGGMSSIASTRVMQWFDRYVALRREEAGLALSGSLDGDLAKIAALRRLRLGDDVFDVWFGEEMAGIRNELERQRLLASEPASDEARRRLAELAETALSPSARDQRELNDLAVVLNDRFARDGTPSAERYRERERFLGADAATRFASLDARREDWSRRYEAYQAQAGAPGIQALPPTVRAARLAELRSRMFDAGESRRVEAMAL